jgi:hypothetical protein
LWIVEVSTGKFTEIATEGFTHPEHVIYGEWAPDRIASTKINNSPFYLFIRSKIILRQKNLPGIIEW